MEQLRFNDEVIKKIRSNSFERQTKDQGEFFFIII